MFATRLCEHGSSRIWILRYINVISAKGGVACSRPRANAKSNFANSQLHAYHGVDLKWWPILRVKGSSLTGLASADETPTCPTAMSGMEDTCRPLLRSTSHPRGMEYIGIPSNQRSLPTSLQVMSSNDSLHLSMHLLLCQTLQQKESCLPSLFVLLFVWLPGMFFLYQRPGT